MEKVLKQITYESDTRDPDTGKLVPCTATSALVECHYEVVRVHVIGPNFGGRGDLEDIEKAAEMLRDAEYIESTEENHEQNKNTL